MTFASLNIETKVPHLLEITFPTYPLYVNLSYNIKASTKLTPPVWKYIRVSSHADIPEVPQYTQSKGTHSKWFIEAAHLILPQK